MKRIGMMLSLTLCGICGTAVPSFAAAPTTSPSSTTRPTDKADAYQASMAEAARRMHACVEIIRQQPLPDEKALTDQLRPALRRLESQMKDATRPNTSGKRLGLHEPSELEMMGEIFYFGAGMTRIRNADNSRADRIVNLMKVESPTFFAIARNIMASIVEDQTTLKRNSAISMLQTLRSQIELYKLQHRDLPPDLSKGWTQFTNRTDETGKVNDKAPYGPYLQSEPINPLTGGCKTKLINSDQKQIARDGYKGFDYVFDGAADHFYIVDADGKLLDER